MGETGTKSQLGRRAAAAGTDHGTPLYCSSPLQPVCYVSLSVSQFPLHSLAPEYKVGNMTVQAKDISNLRLSFYSIPPSPRAAAAATAAGDHITSEFTSSFHCTVPSKMYLPRMQQSSKTRLHTPARLPERQRVSLNKQRPSLHITILLKQIRHSKTKPMQQLKAWLTICPLWLVFKQGF